MRKREISDFPALSFEIKMKILAMSDVHGDTRQIERLAEKAEKEKVELVLFCGDLVLDETKTENIIGPFKKRNLKVAIIPGNHESSATTNFLSEMYKVYNLHGYSIKVGEIGFFGAGHANVGPHMIDDKEMFSLLRKGFSAIKDAKTKVMMTHVHPENSLAEKMSTFPGSAAVKKAIEEFRPDVHFCGHVHECEGIEEVIGKTKSLNIGKSGKIIEV